MMKRERGTGITNNIKAPTKISRIAIIPWDKVNFEDIVLNKDRVPQDGGFRIWTLSSPTIEMTEWLKPPYEVKIKDEQNHDISVSLQEENHVKFFRQLEDRLHKLIFANKELLLPKKNPDTITLDSIKHYSAFKLVVKQDTEEEYAPFASLKIDRRNHKLLRFKGTKESGAMRATNKNISLQEINYKSRVRFTFCPQYLCVRNGEKVSCGLVIKTLIVKQPQKRGFDFILEGQIPRNETNMMYSEVDVSSITLCREVRKYKTNNGKYAVIKNFPRFQLPPSVAPFNWSPPMNHTEGEKLTNVQVSVRVCDEKIQQFFSSVDQVLVDQLSTYSSDKQWFRRKIQPKDVASQLFRTTLYQKGDWDPTLKLKVYVPSSEKDERGTRIWMRNSEGTHVRTDHTAITKGSLIVPVIQINSLSKMERVSMTIKCTDILILEQGGVSAPLLSTEIEIEDSSDESEKNLDSSYVEVNLPEEGQGQAPKEIPFQDFFKSQSDII